MPYETVLGKLKAKVTGGEIKVKISLRCVGPIVRRYYGPPTKVRGDILVSVRIPGVGVGVTDSFMHDIY